MRRLVNQFWLPLLCLTALVSFAPAAQAGNVDFTCAGVGSLPGQCSGTVIQTNGDFSTSDTVVWNATGEYASNVAFTLAFDTSAGTISITDGTNTLVGTINGFSSSTNTNAAQTFVQLDVVWTSLPLAVESALGGPQGLSPFSTVIVAIDTSGNLQPQSVDILISPTPEPTTMILFGSGLLAGAGFLRRKRKK